MWTPTSNCDQRPQKPGWNGKCIIWTSISNCDQRAQRPQKPGWTGKCIICEPLPHIEGTLQSLVGMVYE